MSHTPEQPPDTAALKIEYRSIEFVPLEERRGKTWHLGTLWFMVNAQVAAFAVGLIGPAIGGSFLTSVLGVVVGVLFGTFFMAFHSAQGPRLGLPQMIQSRAQFGYLGVLLPMTLVGLMLIGFNVFNFQLFGEIAETTGVAGSATGIVAAAVAAVLVASVGYHWIHRMERWFTYLFMVFFGVLTIGVLVRLDLPADQWSADSFSWVPFLVMFGISAGWQLAWAPYVSDYSRYLPPSVGHAAPFWWSYGGSALGAIWLMGMGSYLGAAYPDDDSLGSLQRAGDLVFPHYGTIVLLYSMLGLIAVSAVNLYTAGLTLLSMADGLHAAAPGRTGRIATTVVCGLAGMTLALFAPGDFLANFHSFLLLLLYFMIPWTAVNLVDYYLVRRGQYDVGELFRKDGIYGRWSVAGLVSYLVGFLAMIPFFSVHGLYVGAVARALGEGDLAVFVGLLVSAGCYWFMARPLRQPPRAAAPVTTGATP